MALLITHVPTYDRSKMRMPEPWSYEFAAANFYTGKWRLNQEEYDIAKIKFRENGTLLTQYVELEKGVWIFRQSPGFPLQLAILKYVGLSKLNNIILAFLSSCFLLICLRHTFNDQTAFFGVALYLWSPLSLLGIHYQTMDTFSGGAWLVISGCSLFLINNLNINNRHWYKICLELIFGFSTAWLVVVRITSTPIALTLLVVYIFLLIKNQNEAFSQTNRLMIGRLLYQSKYFFIGLVVPAIILFYYNLNTFGRLIDSGYFYPSIYDQYNLWSETATSEIHFGVDTWLKGGGILDIFNTTLLHLKLWIRPGTIAWPIWIIALAGSFKYIKNRPQDYETWVLFFWILLSYLPFAGIVFFGVTRALSDPFNQSWGFFTPSRYLYSMIFPYVITVSYVTYSWKIQWQFFLIGAYMILSTAIFFATLANAYSLSS